MNAFQIESWAIQVVERVEAGQPDEDFQVELKSEWPSPEKAARRLAAHANTARGEPILWLIGVDQKARTVTGANHMELSKWFEQVKAQFDERLAPSLKDLNIPYNGKTVVALLFDTERFPFVVKAPGERLETPWREGTITRSAKRSELLKLLIPLQNLPHFEPLTGKVTLHRTREPKTESERLFWNVNLDLYVEPAGDTRVVIPYHKCHSSLEISNNNSPIQLSRIRLEPPGTLELNFSKTIEISPDELLISGPGKVSFFAFQYQADLSTSWSKELQVTGYLQPVGAERPASFTAPFIELREQRLSDTLVHSWKLDKNQFKTRGRKS